MCLNYKVSAMSLTVNPSWAARTLSLAAMTQRIPNRSQQSPLAEAKMLSLARDIVYKANKDNQCLAIYWPSKPGKLGAGCASSSAPAEHHLMNPAIASNPAGKQNNS